MNDDAAGSHSVGARLFALAARALVALVQLFPRGTALGIAGLEGRTYALLGGPRISVGRVNLRIAFPEWTESRRRSVLAESCANLARSFVELALLSREDPEELRRLVTIEGLEHLEKARQVSKTGGASSRSPPTWAPGSSWRRRWSHTASQSRSSTAPGTTP